MSAEPPSAEPGALASLCRGPHKRRPVARAREKPLRVAARAAARFALARKILGWQ